jgi:CBS domain-containing protein
MGHRLGPRSHASRGLRGLDGESGQAATGELVTVNPDESIEHAAQIMGEHNCSHLIVVAPDSGTPLGVISSLDIARGIAWGSRK